MNDDKKDREMQELRFSVPGMTCGHCVSAVQGAIEQLAGVDAVAVDLETKAVVARGAGLDRSAVWAAVDEAGYEAVT